MNCNKNISNKMVEVQTQATVIVRDQSETEYAVVKFADMSEKMQQHAVDCANHAFKEKRILDDIA